MVTETAGIGKSTCWKRAGAVFLLCAGAAIGSRAQTFTSLASFRGTEGVEPLYVSLVQGLDGDLYGTTTYGGANNFGTVFKVTSTGTVITLYSFCAPSGCPGRAYAGLVLGTDGNFYGTTIGGGTYGYGTVFRVNPQGGLKTLHSFNSTDGASPYAPLVQGADGNFYGTTSAGGAYGYGTVFRLTPEGTLTTLHIFAGYPADGNYPYAPLVQATDGNFYGTTVWGGASDDACAYGCGTVFEISPEGTLTILHSFEGSDGAYPSAGLIQASDGTFYGTTTGGRASTACVEGCGTVFAITSEGRLTTLHSFDSTDGANPYGGLVQATDGNFYGTAGKGGAGDYDAGTVFKITSAGALTTLHSFNGADGAYPYAVVQDTNGTFYGATYGGGVILEGTVFSEAVGLGPFVTTLPASGAVGAAVTILGTNLTGATSVTFNGTAAAFTVVSGSEITTTVPTGATTGKVQVITPGGNLSSNIAFRVM